MPDSKLKKILTKAQVAVISEMVWGERKILLSALLDTKPSNYKSLQNMDKLFSFLISETKKKRDQGQQMSLLYSALSDMRECEAVVSPTQWASWKQQLWNQEEEVGSEERYPEEKVHEEKQPEEKQPEEKQPEEKVHEEKQPEEKEECDSSSDSESDSSDSEESDSDDEPSDPKEEGMKIPVVCSGETTTKLPVILGGGSSFRQIRDGTEEEEKRPMTAELLTDSEDEELPPPPDTPTYSPKSKYKIPKKPSPGPSGPELPLATARSLLFKEGKTTNFVLFFLTLTPLQKEHPCHHPAMAFLT